MSVKTKLIFSLIFALCVFLPDVFAISTNSLTEAAIARQLGWVNYPYNSCGGYYVEPPFKHPLSEDNEDLVEIITESGILSQYATSVLQDRVTVNRRGQQIKANKAYLYRNSAGKLTSINLLGNVHMREPNTLIVAKQGRYFFATKAKSLIDILYRTNLNTQRQLVGPNVSEKEMEKARIVTGQTAWGRAYEFSQTEPQIYDLHQTSFSTCPPINPAWEVKASHLVLNKITGRGYATHARIYVKKIPVFYFPYINFSIDKQRKTGFLWPRYTRSTKWGPSFHAPFYWNIAPNYDMTITPALLSKRGVQVSDNFRYLTHISEGHVNLSVLPNDKAFRHFQKSASENPAYTNPPLTIGQTANVTQAELSRLLDSSSTRKAFSFDDDSRFNDHWSSHIDFNYAGDDYYLQDFGKNLNETTQNQLLQEADIYYKGQNWNFTGRLQAYQTLHPINESPFENNYRRLPQLVLDADYPDQAFGLEYFVNNEATHFDFLNTPGAEFNKPMGNRFHTQPGVSLPLYWTSFFINPRLQLALTNYDLYQTTPTNTPTSINRAVPIFDVASGLAFSRETLYFSHAFEQTLEPQIYYTYIPYIDQSRIPIFDTTVNNLNYDQLFYYNRFTGIDRIGDANQISLGVTSRLIDRKTGWEKVRLGAGEIIYFAKRRVTLCNDLSCSDNPTNHSNEQSLSPLTAFLDYHVNDQWKFNATSLWNPIAKQLSNAALVFQYQPDEYRVLNLGYSFARSGDILSGVQTNDARNNLKVTDISFSWPMLRDITAIGRWAHNWNQGHLQNLLYGLQYDTCCWAVQLVGGQTFIGFNANNNNKPQYNAEFYVQFSLKGLGDIGTGNPTALLSSVAGYKSHFGQEF